MGVIYYKRESKYSGDTTADRSLRCDEVDGNFYFLRGYDINTIDIDSDTNELVVKRVNGETIRVDISQSISVSGIDITFNPETGVLTVLTPDGKKEIPGFLTPETGVEVASDSTLDGNGGFKNPLRVSATEKTGTFAAADEYRDLSENNETLKNEDADGTVATLPKGYRIVTKEKVSKLGRLYSYDEAKEIQAQLERNASEWRMPSKHDWDNMLNAIERENDCDTITRDHDSTSSNEWLGEIAGRKLKTVDMWLENTGLDSYGFSVIPVGYVEDSGVETEIRKYGAFWTTDEEDDREDMYIKRFDFDKDGVYQSTWDIRKKLSIRLVKDFTGNNFYANEYIDGIGMTLPCVHMRGLTGNTVWTSINISTKNLGTTSSQWDNFSEDEKNSFENEIYLINEWDGEKWIKRQMLDGQSIVLRTYGDVHYHEYMVFIDEEGKFELKDTVEIVKEEFQEELDEIHSEISGFTDIVSALTSELAETRVDIDNLSGRVDVEVERLDQEILDEENRATSAETSLHGEIVAETGRATEKENELHDEILAETERATGKETELHEEVEAEKARAIGKENELDGKIEAETERATGKENELHEEVESETTRAIGKENELHDEIVAETGRAIEKEDELHGEIVAETSRATSAETQLGNRIDDIVGTETELLEDLENEITRSVAKDNELDERITNEEARAMAKELSIETFTNTVAGSAGLNEHGAYVPNLDSSYIIRATSLADADNKLDAALKAEEQRAISAEEAIDDKVTRAKIVASDSTLNVVYSDNTEVSVKLNANCNALEVTTSGLLTKLDLVYSDDKISLLANNIVIASIDTTGFTKDKLIKSAELYTVTEPDSSVEAPYIKIVWKTVSGEEITRIPLNGLIDVYSAGNGLALNNNVFSVKIAANSENFISVSSDGVRITGVLDAITNGVNAEKSAREIAINDERSARENADTVITNLINAEKSARENADTVLTNAVNKLNGPYNETGSVKKSIIDAVVGNVVTTITPEEASDQTLARIIEGTGKFYVSNSSSDVKYGNTNVSAALDELKENEQSSNDRILALESALETANQEISDLQAALFVANQRISALEDNFEYRVKETIIALLQGYPQQIDVLQCNSLGNETESIDETKSLKIKFASDSEFIAD